MKDISKKKILIVGAGLEQCLVIKEAKKLGLKVIACDGNPDAPGLLLAETSYVIDIRNPDNLIAVGQKEKVSGIFCHAVEIPVAISLAQKELGLPGIEPEVAKNATIKSRRIHLLNQAGISVPPFLEVFSLKEFPAKAKELGFPIISKPIDCAGARGVRLIHNPEELESAWSEALHYSKDSYILIEKALNGPEISTETVIYNGTIHTFAFADRNYQNAEVFHPYIIENGINFPSVLPDYLQRKVLKVVEQAIHALGIKSGVAKGDILMHNSEPYILEIACRTSGGWFGAGSIPIATGINYLRPLIQMSIGEIPDLTYLKPTRCEGCSQRYWIPKSEAVFQKAERLNEISFLPGVRFFEHFFPEPGTKMRKATNHSERYAQVICTAETREEAILLAESAINSIAVKLEPFYDKFNT